MKSLETIVIGKNVKKIGEKAFYNCKMLKTVTINTTGITKDSIGKEAFKNVPKTVTVKCPKKKLEEYKNLLIKAGVNKKRSLRSNLIMDCPKCFRQSDFYFQTLY